MSAWIILWRRRLRLACLMILHQNRLQKVDEAVTSAFGRAWAETSSCVPPGLIAQITVSVGEDLNDSSPVSNRFSPPPPPPLQQPLSLSQSTASETSFNIPSQMYTPPSQYSHTHYSSRISPHSQSRYLSDRPQSRREQTSAHFSLPLSSSSKGRKSINIETGKL